MLAVYYERLEATNKDFLDMDQKFDIEFDELEVLMEKVAEAQRMADVAMAALKSYEEYLSYIGDVV